MGLKLIVSLIIGIFLLSMVTGATTVTVTSTPIGNIPSDFYGIATKNINLTEPATTYFINTNSKVITIVLWENAFTNRTAAANVDDFTIASWVDGTKDKVEWAYNNGYKVFVQGGASSMPDWLANKTLGCATDNTTCPPLNYTKYAQLQLTALRYYTKNWTWASAIGGFSPWNEPHSQALFKNYNNADQNVSQRNNEYFNIYNASRTLIKQNNSDIPVGGPSGSFGYGTDDADYVRWKPFLANFSDKIDFVDVHVYNDKFNLSTMINTKLANPLYSNCTLFSANCSKVWFTEYNVYNDTVRNNSETRLFYGAQLADFYQNLLNKANSNISTIYYDLNDNKWMMLNTTNNATRISYNITKTFASYHKAGNTVYSSSVTDSGVRSIVSSDSSRTYITLVNTNTTTQSIILNTGITNGNTQFYDVDTRANYSVDATGQISFDMASYEVKTLSTENVNRGCSATTNAGYGIILITSAIAILVFIVSYVYNGGLEEMTMEKGLMLFIGVIFAIIVWQISAQNLGGQCPIT